MAKKNEKINKKARRVVDLRQLPQGKVTVDDVIATNDINELLAEIHEKRASIDGLLVIWRNVDGRISYRYVKISDYDLIGMCEVVKEHCIQESWLSED
jgi:hypothetical protein